MDLRIRHTGRVIGLALAIVTIMAVTSCRHTAEAPVTAGLLELPAATPPVAIPKGMAPAANSLDATTVLDDADTVEQPRDFLA